MAREGLNIEDLNASRVNTVLLNFTVLNASIEERDTGGITPSPVEDVYILHNAILLDSAGTVLVTEDGTPIVYTQMKTDTSHDNIGVLLTDGSIVPYSRVPGSGYPKEQVVGITYTDDNCNFCIALEDAGKAYFCGGGPNCGTPIRISCDRHYKHSSPGL